MLRVKSPRIQLEDWIAFTVQRRTNLKLLKPVSSPTKQKRKNKQAHFLRTGLVLWLWLIRGRGSVTPGETMGAQKARLGRPIERSECGHGPGSHCGLSDRSSSSILRPFYPLQELSLNTSLFLFTTTTFGNYSDFRVLTNKLSNTINNNTIVNFFMNGNPSLLRKLPPPLYSSLNCKKKTKTEIRIYKSS